MKVFLAISIELAASALMVFPAYAQDTAEKEAAAGNDIVVKARKRNESILRVPIVATVLTQEGIAKYQVQDFYGVAKRVPGFIMSESVGTVGSQVALRGVGPTSMTATVDQSVSLNIDGLPLSQGYSYVAGMFDVAQVEVLKGPQALYYGKNSTAGVISLRSADPTDKLEVTGRAGYEFVALEKMAEVTVSGPVNNWLGMRLAGHYSKSKGYFFNTGQPIPGLGALPPSHSRFAPHESVIVRGTALAKPGDRYTARLKVNYVHDHVEGSGGDGQIIACPDGRGGVPPVNIAFLANDDCKLDRHVQLGDLDPKFWPGVSNNGVPFTDGRQVFGTLEQNLELGKGLTLTSVSGYYRIKQANMLHSGNTSTVSADYRFTNDQFTQELRLSSAFANSPINFTLGGFVQDGRIKIDGKLRANTAFGLPPLLQYHHQYVDIWSVSGFGQLLWNLSDRLELSGGARWTSEERTHRAFNDLAGGAEVPLKVPRIKSTNISPDIALTYKPTADLTIFGAYRQGFKSGSFNTIVVPAPNSATNFGDEEAKGGEVGLKARLFDRQMSFNAAAYRYIYSNLQVGATEFGPNGEIIFRTINAASAKVQGVEADLNFTPRAVEGLSINAAVNYNHARYISFSNAICANGQTIGEGCNQLLNPATGRYTAQDLSGRPLVRAPEWSGNAGFDYRFPVGRALDLSIGSTATFSSKYYNNLIDLPGYVQGGYAQFSGNIALRNRDNRWEISLIGNNLTDKLIASSCANANPQNGTILGGLISGAVSKGPAGSDEPVCVINRGRELWVRAGFHF